MKLNRTTILHFLPLLLVIVSLSCSLPGLFQRDQATPQASIQAPAAATSQPTSAPAASPAATTPAPQPLPPAIVESNPSPRAELPLLSPVTFYFNQPMQRDSVESALEVEPTVEGSLSWQNDSILVFKPEQPLAPKSRVVFTLKPEARAANGLALQQPISLEYQTAGYLSLTQILPEPGAYDVDPTSAVVVAFNRPIVPLGADQADLEPAFTLDPAPPGRGEWINTSTYIFYPDPQLDGGKTYTVRLAADIQSLDGSPLEQLDEPMRPANEWSFITAAPRLVSVEPDPQAGAIRLDPEFVLTFNQPMDAQSVEGAFALMEAGKAPISGMATWSTDGTVMTFTPEGLLSRDAAYTLRLASEASARGGTPLDGSFTAEYRTVPDLAVVSTDPTQGGVKEMYMSVTVKLNGPVLDKGLNDYVRFEPAVSSLQVYWSEFDRSLSIGGYFDPATDYTLRISPDLPDPWGGVLGEEFTLRFTNASLPPNITINNPSDALFITGQDATLSAQVSNISRLSLSVGSVPLVDFFPLVSGENAYQARQSYQPAGEVSWQQNLGADSNSSQEVSFYLKPDRTPLDPGLYMLSFDLLPPEISSGPYMMVVSDVQVLFKLGATDVLVWAVSLDGLTPVANAPVTIYDNTGGVLASGQTDEQGVYRDEIPTVKDVWEVYFAVVGEPGQDDFGVALSSWSNGVAAWDFNLPADVLPPQLDGYIYTDRPIYRPGQTVYFRAVVRQGFNGRYTDAGLSSFPMAVYNEYGTEIASFDPPLSSYGTAYGEYTLPADANPGYYRLAYKAPLEEPVYIEIYFQVAEYRKPEIDIQVDFSAEEALASDTLTAEVQASYFYGAPAGDVLVNWSLTANDGYFPLAGYEAGLDALRWMDSMYSPGIPGFRDRYIASGEAKTAADGSLTLEFPPDTDTNRQRGSRQTYTLEVTLMDESGQPVSARGSIDVHPADFYIGVQPEKWVGRAEEESGFKVQVVDWQGEPAGERALRADFQKVVWVRVENVSADPFMPPQFIPEYTPVGSTDFSTDAQGRARLAFTPPEPGTYYLDISGGGARTVQMVWVGGPGQAVWPSTPNNRIELSPDKDKYLPGETAQVFIPNPFSEESPALVTIERGVVLRSEVVTLSPGGSSLEFPLTSDDAPNVYLSVTLLGNTTDGRPDFRVGYINLPVAPVEQTFTVEMVSQPEKTGPGDEVAFDILVTDSKGEPVQGEFSLSVVDRAVLALAEPNVVPIEEAFYGNQNLGIRTGLALSAYVNRDVLMYGGMGGGGDGMGVPSVRERFLDTAFWDAEIITDAQGRARVTMVLPDNLTTWQVLARGVTPDTLVGQGEIDLLTTKDLLIRPVVPRFLVAGDHVQVAAVVQNNIASDLEVQVALQAGGILLDEPASASQSVSVPAGGRQRLEWWALVQDVESVDLLFSANAGELSDAARPEAGSLPVLRYLAPQTFGTTGILDEEGERLELVSLPRTFDPSGGQMDIDLAPSLTAAMASALDVLEHYPYECIEQTLSRFLPNLETYRIMQAAGAVSPDVEARLQRTLESGLQSLITAQNGDGGWGWWRGQTSDPYISAYVLFGLSRAADAGEEVSENVIQRAVEYLYGTLYTPNMSTESWQLDRLVFTYFALAQAGVGDRARTQALFDQRDQLNPWAGALLALTLEGLSPGSQDARTLFSDLEATAQRSATGAHWEDKTPGFLNLTSPLTSSAMVTFALAQYNPESPLLADATRYLVSNRGADGSWSSTYETAWTLLALDHVIQATGDLSGSFAYTAALNGVPLAIEQAEGGSGAFKTSVPVSQLFPQDPNALQIKREAGPGRLYYTVALNVNRPVEDVAPLENGLSVMRAYYPVGAACTTESCPSIVSSASGDLVKARLTLTLNEAAYHLVVEDYIPAGAEILNESLKTTRQFIPEYEEPAPGSVTYFDPGDPLADGWGWWLFNNPRIYDDRIAWSVDYLPAGTYELTYVLSAIQPGEYQVIPARAWQFYFPDRQGNSAGSVFEIQP